MKTVTTSVVLLLALAAGQLHHEARAQPPDDFAYIPLLRVVDLAAASNTLVRIWSDGFAEYRGVPSSIYGLKWTPQEWTPLPENPNAPTSRPVAIAGQESSTNTFYRKWDDGSFDWISLAHNDDNFITVVSDGWTTVPN